MSVFLMISDIHQPFNALKANILLPNYHIKLTLRKIDDNSKPCHTLFGVSAGPHLCSKRTVHLRSNWAGQSGSVGDASDEKMTQ